MARFKLSDGPTSFSDVRNLQEKVSKETQRTIDQRREGTRSIIALVYVVGFLFIVAGSLIAGFILTREIKPTIDLIVGVSAILSGPLGFIIGFYFKEKGQ